MLRRQRLVWYVGFGLIVIGVISLYLSDRTAQGWWQSTSQALGVGLVVGGLIDVLAISWLDQTIRKQEQRLQEQEQRLRDLSNRIIDTLTSPDSPEVKKMWAIETMRSIPEMWDHPELRAVLDAFLEPVISTIEAHERTGGVEVVLEDRTNGDECAGRSEGE